MTATTDLREAADALETLGNHLYRLADGPPERLAGHLADTHAWTIRDYERTDRATLRAMHEVAHDDDARHLVAALADAQDAMAGPNPLRGLTNAFDREAARIERTAR